MALPTYPPTKRGGIHPTYGKLIGGAGLNDAYEMSAEDFSLHRFSTQRRHEKTITSIESALRDTYDSTTGVKFNGALEPTHGTPNEIGKERFLVLLKNRVKVYGQQTSYSIRDPTCNKVVVRSKTHIESSLMWLLQSTIVASEELNTKLMTTLRKMK
jgi:hypothetical protein